MMNTILSSCQLVTPFKTIPNGAVAWNAEGRIIFAGSEINAAHITGNRINLTGMTAAPGLIDIHVHGGFGIEFGLGNIGEELKKYSDWVAHFGVTGFIITITGPNPDFILHTIRAYVPLLGIDYHGAQPLGLHLEGPFINPQKHSAFNLTWIRKPSLKEMGLYLDAGEGWIRHVTLAPELEGADEVADLLSNSGVQVALGHSNANYETASRALRGPFTHVTHTFNAQSPFHHRQPGVVGAILNSESASAELIADGIHIHPAAMQILTRCLGTERIVLITDAMPGAGMPDGIYTFLEHEVTIQDGKALLPNGTHAGSTATLDACVRNMVELVGISFADGLRMAAFNPAKVIGADANIGSLAPGKKANIAVFDESMNVKMTFVNGNLIYKGE
ncbi:MAG: N-acetylglucosamine-6-phosphate deacetylase [Anaerolineaceae bacterium]|nr:N-acetylglucosamine-6-phosphate deacetylase [Anaerolineaceae bacterium]